MMKKPKRRIGLWWLNLIFIISGLLGFSRFWMIVENGGYYQTVGLQVSIGYLAAGGLLWMLLGFGGGILLFFRQKWVPKMVWGCAAGLSVSYWFDRIIMAVNSDQASNWGFMLLMNGLFFGTMAWVFSRKQNKRFFEWRQDE
ncbi:MAG: hypothetical protein J7K85_02435 [Anaerolineaceae bacterium]|nr:hypothetical protein [Anaerolineaceae bacterium]